ncbi:MAG: TonB-dependent receptor [Duncaniella sp.]|nr:TonB-dependent receptor [Duncaniella sp.]
MTLKTLSLSFLLTISTFAARAAEDVKTDSVPPAEVSLGEVSVTAVKQGSSLLRQPVTATIIGRSAIEDNEIVGMKGVSMMAPNFYMPDYGSKMTSSVYVRGIGARIDQTAVGLNIDNIPILNKNGYDLDMPDIDRIEVLRGPQSTLFGRNTIAGLINISTISPLKLLREYDHRMISTRLMYETGLPETYRAAVNVYGKTSDKFGASLSAYSAEQRGYFRNSFDNSKVGKTDDVSLRLKLEWRPSDRVSIENVTSFGSSRQEGYPYAFEETGRIEYNDETDYLRTTFTEGLMVKWTAPGFTLSSITGFNFLNDDMHLDQDFLPESYFTLRQHQVERSITQDLVISGKKGIYSWLAGVYGFYKHMDMVAPVTFKYDGIEKLILGNINPVLPPGMRLEWDDPEFVLGSDFKMPVKGIAVYHRSTVDLGKFSLSASLRLEHEVTAMRYFSRVNTSATMHMQRGPQDIAMQRAIDIDDTGRLGQKFTELLPNFSLTYNLRNSALFLSVARGYKAGGYNTQMFSDILQSRMMEELGRPAEYDIDKMTSYKPETSWNYEVGGHISCDRGRVYTTFAAYLIDLRDQQVTLFPDQSTGRYMANAGRTRSLGGELTLRYTPKPRWLFNLSYGFTHATFRHFSNEGKNLSGNRVPYAPQNTLYLSASHFIPVSETGGVRRVVIEANLYGVGSIYWDEENLYRQPFYAQLGASARVEGQWWSAEIWGKNLTDTRFNVFRFESISHGFYQRGLPVRGGITLRLSLGK